MYAIESTIIVIGLMNATIVITNGMKWCFRKNLTAVKKKKMGVSVPQIPFISTKNPGDSETLNKKCSKKGNPDGWKSTAAISRCLPRYQ